MSKLAREGFPASPAGSRARTQTTAGRVRTPHLLAIRLAACYPTALSVKSKNTMITGVGESPLFCTPVLLARRWLARGACWKTGPSPTPATFHFHPQHPRTVSLTTQVYTALLLVHRGCVCSTLSRRHCVPSLVSAHHCAAQQCAQSPLPSSFPFVPSPLFGRHSFRSRSLF